MPESGRARIRVKLASGAEMEAEGAPEFVRVEREVFLATQAPPPSAAGEAVARGRSPVEPDWEAIVESLGPRLQLRAKVQGSGKGKDACLILLAAASKLLRLAKPTAAQLAKWLRASGYPIRRVDRAVAEGIEKGEILASGSRRSRRYELSATGRLRALILANELADLIGAAPK